MLRKLGLFQIEIENKLKITNYYLNRVKERTNGEYVSTPIVIRIKQGAKNMKYLDIPEGEYLVSMCGDILKLSGEIEYYTLVGLIHDKYEIVDCYPIIPVGDI